MKILGRIPVHPILFAAYAVLFLYAANLNEVLPVDAEAPLGRAILGAAIALAVCSLLLRNVRRGAIVASALVIAFYAYGHVSPAIVLVRRRRSHPARGLGRARRGGPRVRDPGARVAAVGHGRAQRRCARARPAGELDDRPLRGEPGEPRAAVAGTLRRGDHPSVADRHEAGHLLPDLRQLWLRGIDPAEVRDHRQRHLRLAPAARIPGSGGRPHQLPGDGLRACRHAQPGVPRRPDEDHRPGVR